MSESTDPYRKAWSRATVLYPGYIHGMPQPAWAVRGYADDGPAAGKRLTGLVSETQGALSIYVHVPFCTTRCPFCDCQAMLMPKGDVVKRYVERLLLEIEQWRRVGGLATRPVTTVHFGGGTPNAISPPEFERVVTALAGAFGTNANTEWAIETSCRCLDEEHTAHLAGLGFTRIHLGVQTLHPRLRRKLGRRDSTGTVLSRIAACLERGWVLSVDLLYGLPGQTASDLLADLELLAGLPVHGFSLYRLNHGPHNHRFMVRNGLADRGLPEAYADYRMFMQAAESLASRGYVKNHFTHFALEQDRNLYSRHAFRGEDLLALGTTADGVFGDYYYRHGDLRAYLAGAGEGLSLEGGGFFAPAERRARRLIAELMAGEVRRDILDEAALCFVSRLTSAGLLRYDGPSSTWRLTNAGSWFIGACTLGALRLYDPSKNAGYDRAMNAPIPEEEG